MKIKYNSQSMQDAALTLGFQPYDMSNVPIPNTENSQLVKSLTSPNSWTLTKHNGDTIQHISHFPQKGRVLKSPRFIAGQINQEALERVSPLYCSTDIDQWYRNTLGTTIRKGTSKLYEKKTSSNVASDKASAIEAGIAGFSIMGINAIISYSAYSHGEITNPIIPRILTALTLICPAYSLYKIQKANKSEVELNEYSYLVNEDVRLWLQNQLKKQSA